MFNVSIREYFSVLNVFSVCIRNIAVFKLKPLGALMYTCTCLVQCTPRGNKACIGVVSVMAIGSCIAQVDIHLCV